ncbi:hypothetical protein T265_08768 [Opisthorchis viverrini]|uniref:Uncharacterized protein n=1 Tax=Opisthorchis viverrini TaxID=6198 RepID=A0A074ZCI9_OPIVI|nr:hypothetical protein T265_08768 [Opisthorchis viverrini]KER23322.1 hypothetical protein T265_08768 [Opisthorchis viverrini]
MPPEERTKAGILIIIIIIDSMTSVLNTNASLPYSHDLFESLIVKKRIKLPPPSILAGILPGCPSLDRTSRDAEARFQSQTVATSCHPGWDTARMPKPRQDESRCRGKVPITDLPLESSWDISSLAKPTQGIQKADSGFKPGVLDQYTLLFSKNRGRSKVSFISVPSCHPTRKGKRVRILPDSPSLDRESREAEVGSEPRTLRSVNSQSNHLVHLAFQHRLATLTV